MRVLVALKWTRSLNKSIMNVAATEHKSIANKVLNSANYFQRSRRYSTALVNNINNNETVCGTRNISVASVLGKSKDREKKTKKTTKPVALDPNELSQFLNVEKLTSDLEKSIADLKDNFIKNLTIRSSTGAIDRIEVVFDGQEYTLEELVQISRKPKTVILNCSAFPQAIPQILDALNKSGMNLNPQQDGTTLFIPIPKVTKEHRENLSKNAKAMYIKCRDNIKDIRNKEIRSLKKKPSMSEDAARRLQTQIEAMGDQYIREAEKILEVKQKELVGSSD